MIRSTQEIARHIEARFTRYSIESADGQLFEGWLFAGSAPMRFAIDCEPVRMDEPEFRFSGEGAAIMRAMMDDVSGGAA